MKLFRRDNQVNDSLIMAMRLLESTTTNMKFLESKVTALETTLRDVIWTIFPDDIAKDRLSKMDRRK